jgi:hypothetical protein
VGQQSSEPVKKPANTAQDDNIYCEHGKRNQLWGVQAAAVTVSMADRRVTARIAVEQQQM